MCAPVQWLREIEMVDLLELVEFEELSDVFSEDYTWADYDDTIYILTDEDIEEALQ
jgi:hypothetical protein